MKILIDDVFIGNIINNIITYDNQYFDTIEELVEYHKKEFDKTLIFFSFLNEIISYSSFISFYDDLNKNYNKYKYNKLLTWFICGKIIEKKIYKKEDVLKYKQKLFPCFLKNKFTNNSIIFVVDVEKDNSDNILFEILKTDLEYYLNPLSYLGAYLFLILLLVGYKYNIATKQIKIFDKMNDENISLI